MRETLGKALQRTVRPVLIAIGFVALAAMSAGSIALLVRSDRDSEIVERTLEIANMLSSLRAQLRTAESNQRGYLLTGDRLTRISYVDAIGEIIPLADQLGRLTEDHPVLGETMAALRALLVRRIARMREVLENFDESRPLAAPGTYGPGQRLTEQIETLLEQMAGEERKLLQERKASASRTDRLLLLLNVAGAALVVVLMVISIALAQQSARDRESRMHRLAASNVDLEAAVGARTAELQVALSEAQRSAQILHSTIDSMADAVVVSDTRGTVVNSNPAAQRMFGGLLDTGTAEWETAMTYFRADGITPLPPEEMPLQAALQGRSVDGAKFVQRRRENDDERHIVANGRPMRDAQGKLAGGVVVYHDVSALRRVEHQLHHAQKLEAVGKLTGGIAHDFNNSLTVILATIDTLRDGLLDRPQLAEITRMIDDAASNAANLTRQLLTFARMQPLRPKVTDLAGLVVGAERLLRATLGEHVEIEAVLAKDAWPAMVDSSQLVNAVINLAVNARDAMPDGGKLMIETANAIFDEDYAYANRIAPGQYVMIAISDTGSGMSKEVRERVFEPFFTTKPLGKGTGLGLSMVYGFVKQTNGHINLYSEVGRGTTIKIYLPRADVADIALEAAAQPAVIGGPEAILLVEDERLVRENAAKQLRALGYTVQVAADAEQALAAIEAGFACDLLLTDVILPGRLNGPSLAEEVRARRPEVKVLFTSGYADNAALRHGRLTADVLRLPKPYRRADLARMVRVALAGPDGSACQPSRGSTSPGTGTGG